MKIRHIIVAAALAFGLASAVTAAPLLPAPTDAIRADTAVAFTKQKGWKGHKGWKRGHHYGWYKPHRRVYYAYPRRHRVYYHPRRHYGWRHGHHYGWHKARPRRGVYIRF